MPGTERALRGIAALAALLAMECQAGSRFDRARMLNVRRDDPVEIAVAKSSTESNLVIVYWPKVGECQACAAGVAEALSGLSVRSPGARIIEVWPQALPVPESLRTVRAELVRLGPAEYARQTSVLGTPRLEAWHDGHPLLLQQLDERRASADFISQAFDHCLGVL